MTDNDNDRPAEITHHCDPDPDPRGGLLTYSRTLRLLLEAARRDEGNWLKILDETYDCLLCTVAVTGTILGIAVRSATMANPDILMGWELELAGVQAQLRKADDEA